MARPEIGDIVEIDTGDGLAYAHYTHYVPRFGALLRVFNRRYPDRPSDIVATVSGEPDFMTFFPLNAAAHRKIVSIAGRAALTAATERFPLFRAGAVGPNRRVETWWLWDGSKEWRVGPITDELRKLSIKEVVNDTMLIDRIREGWTPEKDVTSR